MIKQTKAQFEELLNTHNIDFDNKGVIVATVRLTQSNNFVAFNEYNPFNNVVVYKASDIYYQSVSGKTCKSLASGGVGYTADNTKLYVNLSGFDIVGSDDFVVVYEINGTDPGDIFAPTATPSQQPYTISLVSLDYINDVISDIKFRKYISTLETINLADGYKTVSSYLDTLKLNANTQIYIGNSNKQPYQADSFVGKKLILPDSGNDTYTIPDNCFAGNTELLEVVIPKSCVGIGAGAFKGCTNLQRVYIGNNMIQDIADDAFEGCTYPELEFEIAPDDNVANYPKYIGMTGCLLEMDQTDRCYSILHATSCFFDPNSEYYFTNMKVVIKLTASSQYNDLPTGFNGNACKVWPGMYVQNASGGNETLYDLHNNVITTTATKVNNMITDINIINARYIYTFIPIYYFIKEIKPSACVGDTNIVNLCLQNWTDVTVTEVIPGMLSLRTIGANAFNGCTALTTIKLPKSENNYSSKFGWGGVSSLDIGESAFEGCTSLQAFSFNWDNVKFGSRALYNCSALASISGKFMMQTGTFNVDTGKITVEGVTYYGEQCFGNTISLLSITDITNNQLVVRNNAIFMNKYGQSNYQILIFGCKGTLFGNNFDYNSSIACDDIGENAFYNCVGLFDGQTPSGVLDLSYIHTVGPSAFYGCTGITQVTTPADGSNGYSDIVIYEKAFYACVNLTSIYVDTTQSYANTIRLYSQSFAKTGLGTFNHNANIFDLKDTDIFDDCVMESVTFSGNGLSTSPNPLHSSNANNENALMTKYPDSGTSYTTTLIKGGPNSSTVNNWNDAITEIKSNAFTGIDMVKQSGGNINIPNTVTKLGSDIFKDSKIDGTDNTATLVLMNGNSTDSRGLVVNTYNRNYVLLFKIGSKYFNTIVKATAQRSNSYHYYTIEMGTTAQNREKIDLVEHTNNGNTTTTIWSIYYTIDGHINMNCYYKVKCGYNRLDTNSYIEQLNPTITVTLLYANQILSIEKERAILDKGMVADKLLYEGTHAQVRIPRTPDIIRSNTARVLTKFEQSDSAFADTSWLRTLNVQRDLTGMKSGFKNCTELQTLATGSNSWPNSDCSPFNGTVTESLFEGCTSLTGITGFGTEWLDYPVIYKESCFKNTGFNNGRNELYYAIQFDEECFSDSGMQSATILGIDTIDSTAFNSNYLTSMKTFGYSGYYFTGNDNASICDIDNMIVVGTATSNLNMYSGVFDKAFKDLKYNDATNPRGWGVSLSKSNYTIGDEAFSGSCIVSYSERGNQGTTFGNKSFENCNELTSVTIMSGATLGVEQFKGCTNLTDVGIGTPTAIPKGCFSGCTSLPQIALPNSVTSVGESAFEGCTALTSIALPNSVTSVGESAFEGCTALASISIGTGITSLNDNTFSGCTSLTSVTLPNNATTIGDGVFSDCTALTNVNLLYTEGPNIAIYPNAFKNCPLVEFSSNSSYAVTRGNYKLTQHTIYKITDNITDDITVLLGTTSYGDMLNGEYSNYIKVIGDYAYCGRGLSGNIRIPDSVTKIGDYAFADNPNITYVIIPSTVKHIGDHAFDGCTNLRGMNLPDSCEYFGEGAVKDCDLSEGLNCNAVDAQYLHGIEYTAGGTGKNNIINGTIDLTNSIRIKSIGNDAFAGSNVKVCRLPKICEFVGVSAFENCSTLVELQINSNGPYNAAMHSYSGITLSNRALLGCTQLKDIWLGPNVTVGPVVADTTYTLYGVGTSIENQIKTLHAPQALNNQTFRTSDFYTILTNTLGFTVQWY